MSLQPQQKTPTSRVIIFTPASTIPSKIREIFILSLGAESTAIHNNMHSLPTGWDITNMENLTTKAREYLATIVSNREHNKQQWEIIKNETVNKSKITTNNKGASGNPKRVKDCTLLEPHQKEIPKEIHQGKHTATRIAH
eukprot:5114105-Ditylum_brightwellii.AAC.1